MKIYNTYSRKKETISEGKNITLYTCGPTVYDYAHIGNFRTYVFEDFLKRTLQFFNFKVLHVMNITDIDDKTIKGAIQKNIGLKEYVKPYIKAFFEDIKILNISLADHYPKATEYINEMIDIIKDLLKKNIAYVGKDKSIYFSIKKFPEYGKLSHLNLKDLEVGRSKRIDADEYDKKNASDFVLWKSYDKKRDGDIFWESPFGRGRPGWHIECSAMSLKLLGDSIDIHCGGVDNIFPHHENEIAQSESYTGKKFVRYWMHSEHLLVDDKKMSKSLGNFFTLRDILNKGFSGNEVRFLLLQSHYRMQLNFTFDGLIAAKHSIERIEDCIRRLESVEGDVSFDNKVLIEKTEKDFFFHLSDDLDISKALAIFFDYIRDINVLIDKKNISKKEAKEAIFLIKKIDSILKILPKKEDISQDIKDLLDKREIARDKKDWKKADEIRDIVYERGFIIEDSDKGPIVKKR